MDYAAHNEETRRIWDAYCSGSPVRVPVILGLNVRYYLLSPWLNPRAISFRDYSEDPDLMMQTQLEFQHYARHNLPQDAEMGMPKDAWPAVTVDLQNYFESGWLGCPVLFRDGQVPDTEPILTDERKRMLFDRGLPDPFKDRTMAVNLRFWEHMREKIASYTFMGLPVEGVVPAGLSTDGSFTTATRLRGADGLCLDIYDDPQYVRDLLGYIAEAKIVRIKAWRNLIGAEPKPESWHFGDDSIQLLSSEAYREFVLPCHKRLLSELAGSGPHSIHLCGDATRHFKTIRDELNVGSFDTGFPVDFEWLRNELGPDVEIKGGPSCQFLMGASPAEVREEVRRILSTGVTEGGWFILREGNNLAPGITPDKVEAMYLAAKEFGGY